MKKLAKISAGFLSVVMIIRCVAGCRFNPATQSLLAAEAQEI